MTRIDLLRSPPPSCRPSSPLPTPFLPPFLPPARPLPGPLLAYALLSSTFFQVERHLLRGTSYTATIVCVNGNSDDSAFDTPT